MIESVGYVRKYKMIYHPLKHVLNQWCYQCLFAYHLINTCTSCVNEVIKFLSSIAQKRISVRVVQCVLWYNLRHLLCPTFYSLAHEKL